MASIFVALLPFILGSALVPLQIVIVLMLLTSEQRGPLKAIAFVTGMTLVRLAQGLLFGFIFAPDTDAEAQGVPWVRATLLTVLGLMLLITAFRKWAKEPDPDAPPPKWLTMFDTITPGRALLMGGGLILIAAKLWVFTLGAISVIREAQLEESAFLWFVIYVLLAQSILIGAILIRLLFPTRATAWLGAANGWLAKHNATIVIVVSLVFGALFLYQGVSAFF